MKYYKDFCKELYESGRHEIAGAFVVRSHIRNPVVGPGLGRSGVDGETLVSAYTEGFKKLTELLTGPSQLRAPLHPHVDVFVVDLAETNPRTPYMAATKSDVPYIVLPCRVGEWTAERERDYALVCATHEGCHVFSHAYKKYADAEDGEWTWFDEATSVWAEMQVSPGNPFTSEYFMHWCDSPERSLDSFPHWYGAGLFAAYLENHVRAGVLTAIWEQCPAEGAKPKTRPIEAILRTPGVPDAVFHEYSVEALFRETPTGPTMFNGLLQRFGGRAFTDSARLVSEAGPVTTQLEPLSTQYYRFWIPPEASTVSVEMLSDATDGVACALVACSGDLRRMDSGPAGGSQTMPWTFGDSGYCVLVLSNDGRSGGLRANVTWRIVSR